MGKDLLKSLSNFASAIENLVEELRKSKEEKKGSSFANKLLNFNKINKKVDSIKKNVESLKEDTKNILKNQLKILDKIKKTRQENDTGVFSRSGDKGQISKIKDGVSSIVLIAGAVLAIGMAFKLIGKVDVTSVLALGVAISAMAFTFSKISEYGMPSPREALGLGLSLIAISGAVLGSAYLLQYIPKSIGGEQLSTFVAIGLTFAAMFALGFNSLIDSMKDIDLKDVLLLPLVLTTIGFGIFAASHFLGMIPEIDDGTLINAIKVGGTLALITLMMSIPLYIISKMGGSMVKGALLGIIILPAISLAIMLSSHLLTYGVYDNPIPLDWALNFSITMLLLTLPVAILGSIGPAAFIGALALIAISAAIAISSHILAYANFDVLNKVADSIAYFIDVVGGAMVDFAKKILPVIVDVVAELYERILPQVKDFIAGVLPPIGDFIKTISESILPAVKEIMGVVKTIILQIDDIIDSISNFIEKIGDIFPKIGTMFERIGNGMAKPLNVVKDIIETVGDTIVRVVDSVTGSITLLSELNPEKLKNVAASLELVGKAVSSIMGDGFSEKLLNVFTGGSNPLSQLLGSISENVDDVFRVGDAFSKLTNSLDFMNNFEMNADGIARVIFVLDKVSNMSGKTANIEAVSKQIIDTSDMVEKMKSISSDEAKGIVDEMKKMNAMMGIVAQNSGNITGQLDTIMNENSKEPKIDF